MLVYSDNYKHNNLIYSQVVVIDVTTNDSTTLEDPGEAQPAGNRATLCVGGGILPPLFPPVLLLHPPRSSKAGLESKANTLPIIGHQETKCTSAQDS